LFTVYGLRFTVYSLRFTVYSLRFRVSTLGLKGGVVGAGDEAGTGFGDVRQFTMPYDTGIGVLRGEVL